MSRKAKTQIPFIYLTIGLGTLLALALFTSGALAWREFRLFGSTDADLAFYTNAFHRALHEHGWLHSYVFYFYNGDALAQHFAPVQYLLLPFYALWQSPLFMLLLSSIGVATCGIGILLLARRVFGHSLIAVVWFGLFALFPPVPMVIIQNTYHEILIGAAFLSLALWYYVSRNNRLFFTMVALGLLAKEDIALLLPVWGAVAWLQGRSRRLAGALVLLGAAYFIVANIVVLPLLRGTHPGIFYFGSLDSPLGNTPGSFLHSIWSRPAGVVHLVFGARDVIYWAQIFIPLLFLPVLGWEYLVIPIYVYAEIALAPWMQRIDLRHIFPAIPFLFMAAMVGTVRLLRFIERILGRSRGSSTLVRPVALAVLLCTLVLAAVQVDEGKWILGPVTPLASLRQYLPSPADSRENARLFQALARIPSQASVAATDSLVAQVASRDRLYLLLYDLTNLREVMAQRPDYITVNLGDLQSPEPYRSVESMLCAGAYGVVYADRIGSGRILLERAASLLPNYDVAERLLSIPPQRCAVSVPETLTPEDFTRAAALHARGHFPSEVRSRDMFLEPFIAGSGNRFTQLIHLPDHAFEPGWYRLDLTGAFPWPSVPFQFRTRVIVGGHPVGEVTLQHNQPPTYSTPPFYISQRGTVPVQVATEVWSSESPDDRAWALRPSTSGCAIAADAPSLNVQQMTLEAWVYLEGMSEPPDVRARTPELEAPILSKGKHLGYYLRLVGNSGGKVLASLSVAGKFSVGSAAGVPFRKWTHIAATYDGHEARIYLNGAPAPPERDPHYDGTVHAKGMPLGIGCRDPGTAGGAVFKGLITGVRIWNRVLPPDAIRDEADLRSLPGATTGLVGSWSFQSLVRGTVPDLSGAGNNLTAQTLQRAPIESGPLPRPWWKSRRNLLHTVKINKVTFPVTASAAGMVGGPLAVSAPGVFSETVRLPDQAFTPGSYTLTVTGGLPRLWTSLHYTLTNLSATVRVGEMTVGHVTLTGAQPFRFTTPAFRIDQPQTLPVRVEITFGIQASDQAWALAPATSGCATAPDEQTLDEIQQMTLEAWVYLEDVNEPLPARRARGGEAEAPILSNGNEKGYYLRLVRDNNGKTFADLSVGGKFSVGRAGIVPYRKWTHIAATYDGHEARIYLNGAPAPPERDPHYNGTVHAESAPLLIGCRDAGTMDQLVFIGLINRVRIWNRVLSTQAIRDEAGIHPASDRTPGLLGSWSFQSLVKGMVPDLSPGARNNLVADSLQRAPAESVAVVQGQGNVLRTVTIESVTP